MNPCWAILLLALAQPQPPDSADLPGLERRAADRALSTREREAAADRAIDVRRRMIEGARDTEPRLPAWLIDQSAAVLARLGRDGSDSAVLFGIPLPSQRDSATRAAMEAAAALDRAARLTGGAPPPEDPRAEATEQDRAVRIPFYRARARVLLAALGTGESRRQQGAAACEAIASLALASDGPEASRRVCLAAGLLMRKSPPDPADAQTAVDELAWVIRTGAEPGSTIRPIALAEAWLGLVHAGAAAGRLEQTLEGLRLALAQAPFTQGGRPDALLTVLAADAATRVLWERAAREQDAELLTRASGMQTALLSREDLGIRPETLRPLILEKLAILGDGWGGGGAGLKLPPVARLGRAIADARDPTRRDTAIAEFRALADTPDAGDFAAEALWEWAVLLTQSPGAPQEDRLRAARALTRLAREYPAHPRAAEAIGAALAHARALAIPDSRAVYMDALTVVTESYPRLAQIDSWRYERARLLADGANPSSDDLATALSMLDEVPARSAVAADADRLHERVQTAVLASDFARIAGLRRDGQEDAIRALARDRTVPEAGRAVQWASARAPESRARYRLDLAEAMVEARDADAAAVFRDLIASEATLGATRVRLGLGRALLLGGDAPGAFTHLREVVAALDAPPADPKGPPRADAYWHAWTLMLETLLAQDKDGSKRGSIRANIKRLETVDANLGGEPWKGRIVRVRDVASK